MQAQTQGYAAALNNLGIMYAGGRGVPQDDAQAVGWYRLAAEQGYAAALNNLGVMYAGGRGVPQDDAEAGHWYRLAANQGVGIAQYNLGSMYAAGRGVPLDYVLAHMWFNLATSRLTGDRRETGVENRDRAARQMTPAQIADAQRLALEWAAAHPREPH